MRLLITAISLTVPIAIAALGEGFSQKSGPLNLSIVGYLGIGAFSAWVIAYFTQNPWLAVLVAMLAGGLLALVFAFFSITLNLSQIVVGIGVVFFVEGLTPLVAFRFWPNYLIPTSFNVEVFEVTGLPLLREIPVIGEALFGHHLIVYFMILIAILMNYVVYKTELGLKIRAVGISASAADAMGISVSRIRYFCIVVCGLMGGLSGAYMTLVRAHSYVFGISGGVGFIAIASVVLGNWDFYKILLASFLFGFIRALHFRAQAARWIDIPSEVWQMLPYIVAIIALFIASYKFKMAEPPELATTYIREEEA